MRGAAPAQTADNEMWAGPVHPHDPSGTSEGPQAPENSSTPVVVDELGPWSTGQWLVCSRGSEHLFDLDAGTSRRAPGAGRSRSRHDGHTVKLTRIERWPRVGDVLFVWVDDHQFPELVEHWLQSSAIVSITQVPGDDAPDD
jgi:hypothetical protein